MTHRVLDVVAEDPEKEHVPEQMAPARVHEHAGEHGLEAEDRIVEEARRHQGPHAGLEPARPGGGAQGRRRLDDEESDVRSDQRVVDEREDARRETIADRKERG